MAVSPVILNKLPFDAELDYSLHFTYSGSQIYGYRVLIQNNVDHAVVYDNTTMGSHNIVFNSVATIPANTLLNGNIYNFQVSVFDYKLNTDGVYEYIESPLSNIVVLNCLKTPIFTFANITQNAIVRNSFVDAEISYYQENGELLNLYTVYLYAANQSLIWSSDVQYANTETVRVPELMDDTTQYIQATGETVNGLEIKTDLIQFSCDYLKSDIFLKFRADNVPDEGAVRLSSNFVLVEGSSNAEELVYIDDEKINLLNNEKVWFDQGFITDNFVCEIILSDIKDFSRIITFNMKTAMCYLTWNYGDFIGYDETMYYAELVAYTPFGFERLNYIITSNKIPKLEDGQQVFIQMKHVDGLFDLKIETMPIEIIDSGATEIIEEVVAEGGDV